LELVNEHIAQETEIFDKPITPETYNNLDVLVYLFQEFISQLRVFIFDYVESQEILNAISDTKGFKKSAFGKKFIENVAEGFKKYYLEMLTSENEVSSSCRLYIPFAPRDPSIPELVEIDLPNGSISLIYTGSVPTDNASNNFANEFAGALKDIFNQVIDKEGQALLSSAKVYKIGYDDATNTVMEQFEGATYLKVMIIMYKILYE
jgi:hypothetical protein